MYRLRLKQKLTDFGLQCQLLEELEENTRKILDILSEIYEAGLVISDMAIAAQEMSRKLDNVKYGLSLALIGNTDSSSLQAELKSVKKERN